jgi:large subunit ribosomal protein L24
MAKDRQLGATNSLGIINMMESINSNLLATSSKHNLSKMTASRLSENLRKQYEKRSIRVIKGDTVKVMRGEYSGIEGKVEKVSINKGTLAIEGVQREKVRGGNVKVQIHASNVMIVDLNLDDKYRQNKIQVNTNNEARNERRKVDTKPKKKKKSKKTTSKNEESRNK